MMRIAITGAGGFVGSHITNKLINSGHKVLCLDNWSTGKREHLNDGVLGKNVLVDIADYNMLAFAFELFKPELVIHCASAMGVKKSLEQPEFFIDTNVKGTLNVLEAMKFIGCKEIIYISTTHVYGNVEQYPTSEDVKLKPFSPYANSKRMAEDLIRSYRRLYGNKYSILRLGNCYGPNTKRGFIAQCIKGLIEFQDVTIYGDGTDTRDYVYVEDVAEAVIKAMDNMQNLTFNISFGDETRSGVVYNTVKKIVGIDREPKLIAGRTNDVCRIYTKVSRSLEKLNWQAQTNLSDGIAKTVKWYKETSSRAEPQQLPPTGTNLRVLKPIDLLEED